MKIVHICSVYLNVDIMKDILTGQYLLEEFLSLGVTVESQVCRDHPAHH